jgi:hypothetical protein
MEPVQAILAALELGAAATSAVDDAHPATARAYAELKTLILSAFGENARARRALEDHAEDPDTYQRPLAKALIETGAARDADVLASADRLLQLKQPAEFDVLRQIAEREEARTGDRFTRMARGVGELKTLEETASRRRMDRYWEEEFERRETLAERRTRQKRQERRMLIGVVLIGAIIVVVFLVLIIVSANG